MHKPVSHLLAAALIGGFAVVAGASGAGPRAFVVDGEPVAARVIGEPWTAGHGYLEGRGLGDTLYATSLLGPGDATVTATLALPKDGGQHAAFIINGHDFVIFQSSADSLQTRGRNVVFPGGLRRQAGTFDHIRLGEPFEFQFSLRGRDARVTINGATVYEGQSRRNDLGMIGFRAGNGLRVIEFAAEGNLRPFDLPADHVNLFVSGEGGYHTYRIPSIIATRQGTLLAFAEGRRHSRMDYGEIHLLARRSTDGGRTWSEPAVVWRDGESTCGNPCPVVDRRTGRIWLPMIHNPAGYREFEPETFKHGTRTVWLTHSDDDGLTWADPREITETTKEPHWQWYAVGPGNSIQIEHGEHAGRLVVPGNYSFPTTGEHALAMHRGEYGSNALALLSDDGGQTWRRSQSIEPRMNENQIVELTDGRLMANMRAYFDDGRRWVAYSEDGGETWSDPEQAPELPCPVNQASFLRHSWPNGGEPGRILFFNSASETLRERLTLRMSYDEAQSWPVSKMLYPGFGAYVSLVVLPDGDIGCFYERDDYGVMTFTRVSLDWLTDGEDRAR